MKTVDKNYSYDELDGFEPIIIEERSLSRYEIGITVSKRLLRPTSAVRKIIFAREYIHFFFNRERRQMLLVSAPNPAKNAIRVVNPSGLGFHCQFLRDLLEKECRIDLTNHLIYIPGNTLHTKKNAVVFELAQAESRKKRTLKK